MEEYFLTERLLKKITLIETLRKNSFKTLVRESMQQKIVKFNHFNVI